MASSVSRGVPSTAAGGGRPSETALSLCSLKSLTKSEASASLPAKVLATIVIPPRRDRRSML
jgi:hypothetical protein